MSPYDRVLPSFAMELYTHVVSTFDGSRIDEDTVQRLDDTLAPHMLAMIAARRGIALNLHHLADDTREDLLRAIRGLGLSIALNATAGTHPARQNDADMIEEVA
jgi:acetylornithine/succinyldiaminopimelate/putrescine aminotransferase